MNSTVAIYGLKEEAGLPSHVAARKIVEAWAEAVDAFRKWQRNEILQKDPTHAQLAEHKKALTWILRWTRMMQSLVQDAEFPAREFAAEVSGRLMQLEESYSLIHDPLTDAEADSVLREAFPDESNPGKPR